MLVPLFKSAEMLWLIAFIYGFGLGCGQPITMTLAFSNAVQGRSGEVMGMRLTANNFASIIGPLLFGAIASGFGLLAVFLANALMLGSGGIFARRSAAHTADKPGND